MYSCYIASNILIVLVLLCIFRYNVTKELINMLCYHTQLEVNDDFHKEILFDMFFDWLQTTKNKMNGLAFNNKLPFSYQVKNKKLIIQDFKQQETLVILYTTSNNEKNNHFIVEILYSYTQHTLNLNFYITMTSESTYFSNVSIPQIFRTLIKSPYILKDQTLSIDEKPIFIKQSTYQRMKKTHYHLPLVIIHLSKHKKGCIHPYYLAKELIGIAHVICLTDAKEDLYSIITIRYPNKQDYQQKVSPVDNEKIIIHHISNKLRNYYIQEQTHIPSYQKLQEIELKNKHQTSLHDNQLFQEQFQQVICEKKAELEFFKSQYQELLSKKEKLIQHNKQLELEKEKIKETPLLICQKEQVEEFQNFLIRFIEAKLNNLDPTETYRKRTVLQSIIEKNK